MKRQQIYPLDDWGIFLDIEHGEIQEYNNGLGNHLYTIYEDDECDDKTISGFIEYLRSLFVRAISKLFRKVE